MNKQTIAIIVVVAVIILGGAAIAGWNQMNNAPAVNTEQTPPATQTIVVYFTDTSSPEFETSCAASAKVNRTIPMDASLADASLNELLKGPTAKEKAGNLEDLFHMENELPLAASYIGVTLKDGVATVNFKESGLRYLNSPACMQASIKSSIENTLKQFAPIKTVEYAID